MAYYSISVKRINRIKTFCTEPYRTDFFTRKSFWNQCPSLNKEYQELTNVSRQMATIDLTKMVKKSVLERIGKAGKGIAYQLP